MGVARDIRDGSLKKYLVQPLDMLGYLLSYRLAHKAAWNKALALLAANRIDDLKAQLEAIRKDKDHGFYTQAGDLLKKM